ncbi:MAG: RidA family protein [Flavobacterium sp.]|nr:RidA family protein [Pedobacter sp.]
MKKVIYSNQAPEPIGPYSQAIQAGNMLFVSGQIAIVPSKNEMIEGSISDEAVQVMKNIENLLIQSGYSFADVVKTTIFLSDMKHFAAVNDVYSSSFKSEFPARETVAVLGLPKNANVEISVIAYKA